MPDTPWIRTEGMQFVDEAGNGVILAGVGLGGWMNMENFITGYPGNEEAMRRRLLETMGSVAYDAFFDTLIDSFFKQDDAALLASLGMNSVRIPINYRHFEDDATPFVLKESGFRRLDRVIALLADHGIYSIIDLHAAPGYQNHHWHSDNPTHQPLLWTHTHFQDRVVHLWEALADRYKDRPEVAGYNLLNEPADESGEVLPAFYQRLESAVRAIDNRHILFLDGNRYSTDFSCFDEPYDNAVYSCHDYALPGILSAAEYPGVTRGEYFDRSVLEETFLRRTEFMRRTETPIWVGEFGPMHPPNRPEEPWRYQILRDQLDIYREHNASWALWTYKDVGMQGLVYADPSGPYMTLTKDVRAAKDRLGVDSWGGSDEDVRDILDPIDAVFDTEFPDFEPYPWGRRQHIFGLVRHILLAEPLADRYAEVFKGVGADEAIELAESFRLDHTIERTGLTSLLRDHLAAGS